MKLPKVFKKVVTAVCALALAIGVAGCGGGDKEQFINIATGGTAGTYYPIGGAIAEVLNKNGMNASAQSTGASVANINMLKDKQVELAIVQNDITYYAVNGEEMFKEGGKIENLNGIASLYPETCQFVVREDSGIKDITALKGKRVAVGAAGSGAEANARQISYALKDGTVDAAFVTAGYPTASVQDIASQNKIRLLPVGDEQIKKLAEKYPFYTKTTVPAGTYQGFDQEIQTVSVMAILVANDKIDAALGEKLTKVVFDNLDKIAAAHSAGKSINKATALEGLDFIKINEGAAKVLK